MVYLFKLSIGQSVDIPLADLVSMLIEKKVQLAAELRVHQIIILNKINKYLNWIILKRWITKLDLIHVI